jgi:hypothetical protein
MPEDARTRMPSEPPVLPPEDPPAPVLGDELPAELLVTVVPSLAVEVALPRKTRTASYAPRRTEPLVPTDSTISWPAGTPVE